MDLKQGDIVRTPIGVVGKVVHISRLTAFVAFPAKEGYEVQGYLGSELSKIPNAPRVIQPPKQAVS
jgi:hypothetical protein